EAVDPRQKVLGIDSSGSWLARHDQIDRAGVREKRWGGMVGVTWATDSQGNPAAFLDRDGLVDRDRTTPFLARDPRRHPAVDHHVEAAQRILRNGRSQHPYGISRPELNRLSGELVVGLELNHRPVGHERAAGFEIVDPALVTERAVDLDI